MSFDQENMMKMKVPTFLGQLNLELTVSGFNWNSSAGIEIKHCVKSLNWQKQVKMTSKIEFKKFHYCPGFTKFLHFRTSLFKIASFFLFFSEKNKFYLENTWPNKDRAIKSSRNWLYPWLQKDLRFKEKLTLFLPKEKKDLSSLFSSMLDFFFLRF